MNKTLKNLKQWWNVWGTLPVLAWVKAAGLYQSKRYQEAIKFYEQGLKKRPKHRAARSAYFDLAYCYFKIRSFDKAENYLKTIIEKDPNDLEAIIRLAYIYNWYGNNNEASKLLRSAIKNNGPQKELVLNFCFSVVEAENSENYLKEAVELLIKYQSEYKSDIRLDIIKAALAMSRGEQVKGKSILATAVTSEQTPLEGYLYFAEILMQEQRTAQALRTLREALAKKPNHPRLLSMLAECYLMPGSLYNPAYAMQLATQAVQESAWQHPGSMHVLAESYRHTGDKVAALLIASKAKGLDVVRSGGYSKIKTLDILIDSLSSGTLV